MTFESSDTTGSTDIHATRSDRSDRSADVQWQQLRKQVRRQAKRMSPGKVFGEAAASGGVYRWGISTASGEPCPKWIDTLSKVACDIKLSSQAKRSIDLPLAAEQTIDRRFHDQSTLMDGVTGILWAAALPGLLDHLDTRTWWDLVGHLQHVCEVYRNAVEPDGRGVTRPDRLLLGGELGLTLAWRLADLPSCARLKKSSTQVVKDWLDGEADSIAAAVESVHGCRLVLASLVRCERLLGSTTKSKFSRRQRAIAADLVTWVAGLCRSDGTCVFNDADRVSVRGDVGNGKAGQQTCLLGLASRFAPDMLIPAIDAASGKTQTGGRLAWEVSLPEALIHCEDAKVAVMMPEWDVRRGRTFLDYRGRECRIEIHAGRRIALGGHWEVQLRCDESDLCPTGDWESTCEYGDDDVHYLELEQPWSEGWLVQRQVMVIRDDRCVLLADSVLPERDADADPRRTIQYIGRLPLGDGMMPTAEDSTREWYLQESLKDKIKNRVLVVPLSGPEWRISRSAHELTSSPDGHLVVRAQAKDRLYAPLWLDFLPKRFKRKRTWRPLTVADELRIVGAEEAVGYRVQMGGEHWLIYRSMQGDRPRSLLGKHIAADFLAARFHPDDGGVEELVSVRTDE